MTDKQPDLRDIKVGDEVIIQHNHGGKWEDVYATVTKIARVWIDVDPVSGWLPHYSRRFRRDDQSDGSNSNYRARLYTREQWAWKEREAAAGAFLKEAGIELGGWGRGGRYADDKVTLANIIRKHEGLPEL